MFSMSTPCFVRPSFGKDALNFENPFDIFLDEEKTVRNIFKIIFRAPDFFTWLWLYIPTLQNNLEMLPQPGDMETILDLLGPIIDRFPKLFFCAIYQGQWLHLSASALKQTDANGICPSLLQPRFRFFRGSGLNTAKRCTWPSQVTWRRRLPGPPHQRCCPDLIWIWRGINGEHWFRFQKLSFELSRSHGHYSCKYLKELD